jgi:transketolase
MLTLHHRIMRPDDLFLLSKGHAAGALYVTLWSQGLLTEADLSTFHADHTKLAGHPVAHAVPGVRLGVGSLGHGLGLAAGLGLGKKLRGQSGRLFCLLSDGEWNEGSTWESLMFLVQHDLRAVIPIIDRNGFQGLGRTAEVLDLGSLAAKLGQFGMDAREVDGHDPAAIEGVFEGPPGDRPLAVVARTVKGHGVSFMENRTEWHYLPMTAEQYRIAVEETSRS